MEIPLNGFYVHDSLPVSNQECTNWIPVKQDAPAWSQRQLIGTEGIRTILFGSGSDVRYANRGAHVVNGNPFFVNGGYLYLIERQVVGDGEFFVPYTLGTIAGSGRVSMADNGNQLMILCPGGKGYIYSGAGGSGGSGLVEITDPDFRASGNPLYVVFIDGYFACNTDEGYWIVSALNNGLSWDALDRGTAESDPDPIVAPVVYNNQIFLCGSITTEGFQNIGGAGFPFQRSNVFLDKGCHAPFSLISTNQRFFMIGGGKNEKSAVWSSQGSGFEKVSTTAIDNILHSYDNNVLAEAFAIAWGSNGQYFVSFTVSDRTVVYNMSTGLWHEQKSGIANSQGDYIQGRWRVNSLVTAYGYNLVGDYIDGRIGVLDADIYTEYDISMVRIFSTMPLSEGRCPKIELTMEAGIGNDDAPEPLVSMAISKDGKTFGYERDRKIGALGKYKARTIWRKNGRFPRMGVLRFRLSDPVKPVVIKLEADFV